MTYYDPIPVEDIVKEVNFSARRIHVGDNPTGEYYRLYDTGNISHIPGDGSRGEEVFNWFGADLAEEAGEVFYLPGRMDKKGRRRHWMKSRRIKSEARGDRGDAIAPSGYVNARNLDDLIVIRDVMLEILSD
jgi:hypothetical protein